MQLDANGDDVAKMFTYNQPSQISENLSTTVHIVDEGHIIIGTDSNGLKILKETDSTTTTGIYSLKRLNKGNGFNGVGVYENASFLNTNNDLYLGSKKGFTILNVSEDSLEKKSSNNKPFLSSILVNSSVLDPYFMEDNVISEMYGLAKREIQDDNSAIKNLNIPKQLTLKNPFNNIIFNYCSIS